MYPAFAVAEALQQGADDLPPVELDFVGGVGASGMEPELIARSGIAWRRTAYIQGGPIHGVGPMRMAISLVKLVVGFVQALVFTLLAGIYISLMTQHDEEHAH